MSTKKWTTLLDNSQQAIDPQYIGRIVDGVEHWRFNVDPDLEKTPQSRDSQPASHKLANSRDLLTVALNYGTPTGYLPEHGGDIVQQLFPIPGNEHLQISTSSKSTLELHTETSFMPDGERPTRLVIGCLRSNPEAATTFVRAERLAQAIHSNLGEKALWWACGGNVRTGVDRSFWSGEECLWKTPEHSILHTSQGHWRVRFDVDLTESVDSRHDNLVAEIGELAVELQEHYVLQAGDLIVVDNTRVIHGRTPFTPAYETGQTRWLLRTFVTAGKRQLGDAPVVNTRTF